MNRQEAVLLLKEIMTNCESFNTANAVTINNNESNNSWELYVNWTPHPLEADCLNKIVANHGLEMVATNGRTIFRSIKKG